MTMELEKGCQTTWTTDAGAADRAKKGSYCDKGNISRRGIWSLVLVYSVALYLLYSTVRSATGTSCTKHTTRVTAEEILTHAPLIDGHNDWPFFFRILYGDHINSPNFTDKSTLPLHVDFPRLRQGRVKGQFWSVFVPCPDVTDRFDDDVYLERVHDTFQQIDLVHRLAARFPDNLRLVSNLKEFRSEPMASGRIASFMGVEGLHQIGNSASILRMYYDLGVRYVTLTHTCHNRYADSESPSKPLHHGLSSAGEDMILEMNRIGMIVDISHTSAETMRAALYVSQAPVIFSHSNAYHEFQHTRNVPDGVLFALQRNRGVIMTTFYPAFLAPNDGENATLSDVVDNIMFIGQLIGFEHIGLGSDFDGMMRGPAGLEDVSKYPDLVDELLRQGLSRSEIEGIIGGNVLRVLGEVEEVALKLSASLPLEDDVKPVFNISAAA